MATQTQIGKLLGTAESPQLAYIVWDDGGATMTAATALAAAIAASPATVFSSPRDADSAHSVQQLSNSAWQIGIAYRPVNQRPLDRPEPPAVSTKRRRCQFNAKPSFLYNFLEPIGVYRYSGGSTINSIASYPNTKWKIDASGAGLSFGWYQSHGRTFQPLPENASHDVYLPNADVDDAYFNTVRALCGAFNNATFLGYPAGSVQLVRFSADPRSNTDWELQFGFGVDDVLTSVDVGGNIVIPTVRPCDYYWTRDKTTFNPSGGLVELEAELAFLGRWGRLGSFSGLEFP